MKKKKTDLEDDLKPEYDLSKLKFRGRGLYAAEYAKGTNLVLLDAEVYKAFPDSASVNTALKRVLRQRKQKEQNPAT
jgi:hypothetical protein